MQLGDESYISDGEAHPDPEVVARIQTGNDFALKSSDFETQSAAVAAVKLHSTNQSCTVCRTKASGGNNSRFRCKSWVNRDRTGEADLAYPEPVGSLSDRKKKILRNKWLFEVHWKNSNGCMYNCGIYKQTFKETGETVWCISNRSNLTHKDDCCSQGGITMKELLTVPEFSAAVRSGNAPTEKACRRIIEKHVKNHGLVSKAVIYRAKRKLTNNDDKFYADDFKKMPYWNSEFTDRNGKSRIMTRGDSGGKFHSQWIIVGQMIDVAELVGQKFTALDTCFSRHVFYNGKIWVLVTRDSNNKVCVLAYGTSPQENNPGASDFGDICATDARLTKYLCASICYTDGGPALPTFIARFEGMIHKRCFEHLIK